MGKFIETPYVGYLEIGYNRPSLRTLYKIATVLFVIFVRGGLEKLLYRWWWWRSNFPRLDSTPYSFYTTLYSHVCSENEGDTEEEFSAAASGSTGKGTHSASSSKSRPCMPWQPSGCGCLPGRSRFRFSAKDSSCRVSGRSWTVTSDGSCTGCRRFWSRFRFCCLRLSLMLPSQTFHWGWGY